MVMGGKKICDEKNGLAAASEFYGLNVGVVARNADGGDAGDNFGVASKRVPLAGLLDGKEIFLEVAGAVAFAGTGGVSDFRGLDYIFGVWKSGNSFVVNEFGVAAGVVEVEMGVDDDVDLIGADTVRRQVGDERVAFLNPIDVAQFGSPFRAVAGFDENVFVLRSNEQAVGGQPNAVAIIGWRFFLPERFGHDAEHGAAVEIKTAAVNVLNFNVAEVHWCGFLGLQAAFGEDFVDGGEGIFAALGYVRGELIESSFSTGGVQDALD